MLNNNPLTDLMRPTSVPESWRWATVVQTNPVRVRLDGDTEPLLATPDCLVPVSVGDRVRVHMLHRRMTIAGKLYRGSPDPGSIVIGGTAYATSGTIRIPAFTWAFQQPPVYATTVHMPIPYMPPDGWSFQFHMAGSTGFTFLQNIGPGVSNGGVYCRLVQFGNASTTAAHLARWQLVKN
ncbi:hypothetical protein [Trueperella bialowiezensis]|uniref:Uncharacterized protein n=1 Tax=Trueperella bialowiezensis TaxID=312285 RepID=A0A448PE76_9ACTO|nr:hypothetical protein [Trueperella bialowiezensis]VEI13208.1 Uncharacterised protein [Trueperella bialowiezensis]